MAKTDKKESKKPTEVIKGLLATYLQLSIKAHSL